LLTNREGGDDSLNRKEKEQFVSDMKARLEKARGTYLIDYAGLDVASMSSLRRELKKSNAELQVVKNRLLKLACLGTETECLKDHFIGPCGITITDNDAVAPAKVLVDQSKALKNLEIKVGQIGGKPFDEDSIKRIAELPGRDVLLAQVLSTMQGVPASFVRVLNGVTMSLLQVLNAIGDKKGAEAG
jgi:large subunit ribosomal protein L10